MAVVLCLFFSATSCCCFIFLCSGMSPPRAAVPQGCRSPGKGHLQAPVHPSVLALVRVPCGPHLLCHGVPPSTTPSPVASSTTSLSMQLLRFSFRTSSTSSRPPERCSPSHLPAQRCHLPRLQLWQAVGGSPRCQSWPEPAVTGWRQFPALLLRCRPCPARSSSSRCEMYLRTV